VNVPTADSHHGTRLLTVLLMAVVVANIDVAAVNVATPSIREQLGATDSELQLVVSGYIVSYAMLLIASARLGAIYGYRRLFILGLGTFTTASVACGLAWSPITLIVARVIQGAGAAMLAPQVLTGIQLNFSGVKQTRAIGLYAISISVGAVAGQVLGGLVVSADLFDSGWRPIFLINLPIGAGVMIAAMRLLPMHPGAADSKLDLWGLMVLSLAILLAVIPLVLGQTQHWPTWMWASLLASPICLFAFVVIERRVEIRHGHPLVNLRILSQPEIGWALTAYGTGLATYFALLFTLALYLQEGLGESALQSGLTLVSWVLAFGAGGLLVPRAPLRFARFVAPVGYAVLAASYLSLGLTLVFARSSGDALFILLGFGGLGMGIGVTATIRRITAAVSPADASDLSGLIMTTAQIFGVAGVSVYGTGYFALMRSTEIADAKNAFACIVITFAGTAILSALAAHRSGNTLRGAIAKVAQS
jgi:predicted MFS family arabinose efflux permease